MHSLTGLDLDHLLCLVAGRTPGEADRPEEAPPSNAGPSAKRRTAGSVQAPRGGVGAAAQLASCDAQITNGEGGAQGPSLGEQVTVAMSMEVVVQEDGPADSVVTELQRELEELRGVVKKQKTAIADKDSSIVYYQVSRHFREREGTWV